MPRKDQTHQLPVDNYRNKIGTNELKKNKKFTEQLRMEAQNRKDKKANNFYVNDLWIILFICGVLAVGVYFMYFHNSTDIFHSAEKQLRGMI